jgi:cytochrome b
VPRQISREDETLSGHAPKQPVWDVAIRLFHWSLVVLIALAWWTAETDREDLHFYLGYAVLSALIFRVLWGVLGSSTARFANFVTGPRSVFRYVRQRFSWPVAGHAPLGALSVVALLALLFFQVGTGLFAGDEDGLTEGPLAQLVSIGMSDTMRELHEEAFNVLLALIALHVAAILSYRMLLGKNLLGPMITGRARLDPGVEPMRPGRWWVALICLAVGIGVTRWIIAGAPPFGP